MIRRLTSGPNPASRVSAMTSSADGAVVADAQPVAHRVEPGEVGRHLAGQDQVVGRQAVLEVRAADLDDLGAQLLQPLDRRAVGPLDARLVALAAELADHADPHPAQVAGAPARAASTTGGTGASIEVESQRVVPADRPRAAARRRAPCGRTGRPGPATTRRRPARSGRRRRRSASPRPCRSPRRAGGSSRRCRCRSPAAPRTPPAPPPSRRPSRRGCGRCPRGCGWARTRSSRWTSPSRTRPCSSCRGSRSPAARSRRGHGGVVRRPPALQDPRAAGGGHVRGGEHVLERERDAGQRRRGRAAGVAARRPPARRTAARPRRRRAGRRARSRRRRRSGPGAPARPRRRRPRRSGSSRPARPRCSRMSSVMPPPPGSAAPGTARPRRPARRPAPAPAVRPGRRSSARNTFCSGTACEVGGISSAATSPTRATAPRMTSSWPANRSSSRSVTASRASRARCATSSRLIVPGESADMSLLEDVCARNNRLHSLTAHDAPTARRSTPDRERDAVVQASRRCCLPPAPA